MLARPRFWLYRNIVALFTLLGFRAQKVIPLVEPVDGPVQFRPYAEVHPRMPVKGLYLATTFPASDQAPSRLERIHEQTKLLAVVKRIAPAQTPPVPRDEATFLAAVYPRLLRKAWPAAPTVPGPLAGADDLVAELAVRGPFASFLRKSGEDRYEFGDDWISGYEVAPGLARPGGTATLVVRDGRLLTERIGLEGTTPEHAQAALLAGLNERLTTFRHNVDVHLTMLTSFALATTNHLDARHPVRRLVHHCFNTVLIGNVELSSAQLCGPKGFLATIFSHPADVLLRMVDDHVGRFDFWDYEPPTQFERRGTAETPFAYPYRDNVMAFWAETRDYVDRYLGLYYDGDDAVAADAQVAAWTAELDRLMPNGVGVPAGAVTLDWLARLCATLIHVSTVEHDILNNVVWDYTTLGWLTPTVVPLSGEPMDQRRAFDLIATLVGTWKRYNMLLTSDVPKLALDDQAAAVMRGWIERLDRLQDAMAARQGRDPSLSYPANLNISISN
jgi:arachidonate 15-lipoxygenase